MLEFVLFAILGFTVFAGWPQPAPQWRWFLAVIYVVLMVIWAFGSTQGWNMGFPRMH
jgi:hypothetical protein